jgi:ketosteroid isomerase-like protein
MRRLIVVWTALLVLCGGVLGSGAALGASPEEEVTAAYAAWDDAFNKGDAKAVSAFYVENAVFLPATHDVIEGPAGVETFLSGIFGMGVTGHKLELIKAGGEGNLVYR